MLSRSQISGRGFEHLPVGIALGLKRGQPLTSLRQFRFGRCGTNYQLRAAFVVMAAAHAGAIDFQIDLAQALAILAQFRLDGIAALGAIPVLRFQLLHRLSTVLHVFGQSIELRVEFKALLVDSGKLARQNYSQLCAHLFAQLGVALGLRGLTLQRIHLSRDFVENIVHAGKIQLGVFQSSFGEALLGLEFRDSGCFFEDGSAIGWTAAEDLADAPLLDQRVGLRAETRAHEEFLNVAQAAEFAIQQILAVAGAEEATRHNDFSSTELLLVEFPATDLENDLWCADDGGRRNWRNGCKRPRRQREHWLVVREGDCDHRNFRARNFCFFCFARLGVFDRALGFFGGAGAHFGFVPIFGGVS